MVERGQRNMYTAGLTSEDGYIGLRIVKNAPSWRGNPSGLLTAMVKNPDIQWSSDECRKSLLSGYCHKSNAFENIEKYHKSNAFECNYEISGISMKKNHEEQRVAEIVAAAV